MSSGSGVSSLLISFGAPATVEAVVAHAASKDAEVISKIQIHHRITPCLCKAGDTKPIILLFTVYASLPS